MKTQAQIGIVGLAVMGENLVLNMADKGISVAVHNRTTIKVDAFLAGRAQGKSINGFHTVRDSVGALEKPRKIVMMLKAGRAVDSFFEQLLPYLDQGDILIDGGNSNYHDSARRMAELETRGLLLIGTGVSGGEEGALKGPPIMPGGSYAACLPAGVNIAESAVCPYFTEVANSAQNDLRLIVATSAGNGIPIPCLWAALSYYDSLRTSRLLANLLQAQRDYFGAHTYERVDKPRGEFFHTDWTGQGGNTTSTAYSR